MRKHHVFLDVIYRWGQIINQPDLALDQILESKTNLQETLAGEEEKKFGP